MVHRDILEFDSLQFDLLLPLLLLPPWTLSTVALCVASVGLLAQYEGVRGGNHQRLVCDCASLTRCQNMKCALGRSSVIMNKRDSHPEGIPRQCHHCVQFEVSLTSLVNEGRLSLSFGLSSLCNMVIKRIHRKMDTTACKLVLLYSKTRR